MRSHFEKPLEGAIVKSVLQGQPDFDAGRVRHIEIRIVIVRQVLLLASYDRVGHGRRDVLVTNVLCRGIYAHDAASILKLVLGYRRLILQVHAICFECIADLSNLRVCVIVHRLVEQATNKARSAHSEAQRCYFLLIRLGGLSRNNAVGLLEGYYFSLLNVLYVRLLHVLPQLRRTFSNRGGRHHWRAARGLATSSASSA
mmetsp:Transcript_29748/g.81501  ORF Transcript_29748/g.81501 Transcript_29748/m.81501 type:complete len:200 (+) Transcript_29748:1356-1955(+)